MDLFAHAPVREGDVLAKKYRVERVLGMGGMGIVVAARHLELDQPVALKFLLPTAMDSEEMVSRFLNEGRAVVRLKSEHVAKVLDVGRLDDGAPYIVMELLEGQDLAAVMRDRKVLAVEDAASFLLQACEAVAEAHSAKIIHRDLKPQNLFLTMGTGGDPLIKVLDFGVSKSLSPTTGSDGGAPLTLTRTQSMLGSPLYMSPEQMRSSKRVDERSDIWSLGVILFELLTGRVPFEAENVPELVFKIAENDAPNPKELRADLPDALCATVLHCLQKDADKRFASIADLATELEPYVGPREKGLAARIGVMLGTQPRPRMMSFSDVSGAPSVPGMPSPSSSGAKSAPAVAVSDAWGATHAAPVPLATKKKSGGGRTIGIAIGVLAIVGLGAGAFAITSRSRASVVGGAGGVAGASSSAFVGNGGSPAATNALPSANPAAVGSGAVTPEAAPSAAPSGAASAATGTVSRPVATNIGRPGRPAASSTNAITGHPDRHDPVTAPPSTSGRGGFIPVRE
jgi:serine/threonine-protein kinase